MPETWLMLSYTLPREPSRVRVSVWRKLKKLGAISLGPSMWVLPGSDDLRISLDVLKDDILKEGGEALLISASVDVESERVLIMRFSAARDEEYTEFLEQCADFLHELKRETERHNLTFAEIEENEADLEKLTAWHQLIAMRDFFGAPLQNAAAGALSECAAALEAFCARVYENSSDLYQE